jgi:hypothetical protein
VGKREPIESNMIEVNALRVVTPLLTDRGSGGVAVRGAFTDTDDYKLVTVVSGMIRLRLLFTCNVFCSSST